MPHEAMALMGPLGDFFKSIAYQLDAYFPWCVHLDNNERQAFMIDLLQAVHSHDVQQLQAVVDAWQETAKVLADPEFMKAWRASGNSADDVPWEQVRGDSSLSGEAEERRSESPPDHP